MSETLRKIAEDIFLTAVNIRTGDLGGDSDGYLRIVEVVTNLGERLCRTAGVEDPWIPSGLTDIVDYSLQHRES